MTRKFLFSLGYQRIHLDIIFCGLKLTPPWKLVGDVPLPLKLQSPILGPVICTKQKRMFIHLFLFHQQKYEYHTINVKGMFSDVNSIDVNLQQPACYRSSEVIRGHQTLQFII